MALDLTNLATFQAKARSRISCSEGTRSETTVRSSRVTVPRSRSWTSRPPVTRLRSWAGAIWPGQLALTSSRRTFFFSATMAWASSLTPGAMITSTN